MARRTAKRKRFSAPDRAEALAKAIGKDQGCIGSDGKSARWLLSSLATDFHNGSATLLASLAM